MNPKCAVRILAVTAVGVAICVPLQADIIDITTIDPPGIQVTGPSNGDFEIELGTCDPTTNVCQLFGGGENLTSGLTAELDITSNFHNLFGDTDGNAFQEAPVTFSVSGLRSTTPIELTGSILFQTFNSANDTLTGTVTITGGTGAAEYAASGNKGLIFLGPGGAFIQPAPEPASVLLLGLVLLLLAWRSKCRTGAWLGRRVVAPRMRP